MSRFRPGFREIANCGIGSERREFVAQEAVPRVQIVHRVDHAVELALFVLALLACGLQVVAQQGFDRRREIRRHFPDLRQQIGVERQIDRAARRVPIIGNAEAGAAGHDPTPYAHIARMR